MVYIPHNVKCSYCGEIFDRDRIPFEKVNSRRYAHKTCYEEHKEEIDAIEADKQLLEDYANSLCTLDNLYYIQLKKLLDNKYYTYKGIYNTLKYIYEIKKMNTNKGSTCLGLVPYMYKEANEYFGIIEKANQSNATKEFFADTDKIIKIPIPKRKTKERRLFSFLDEENDNAK